MATSKQLDDITECTVCTEEYKDPRVLPCGHTYCLKCIVGFSKDKQPGDEVACPLCRKEFILSSNGVEDLPKNYFVANFLQMKELSMSSVESKESLCGACSDDGKANQNIASVYCIECHVKLCQNCERGHKAIKFSRSHKLINIGEKLNLEDLQQLMPPSFCDQHKEEYLKVYCFDCQMTICMMCYIKAHHGHRCSDIDEVVIDFRKQMAGDVDNVVTGAEKCREMLQKLEAEKSDFIEQVAKTKSEISEKAEKLKQMIDDHKDKLVNELSSKQQNRMKEIESLREEIERQLISMESYKKYVDELRQKGTACDVARDASGLHDRADELLNFDEIERSLADLEHADIWFMPSDFVVDDASKTLGQQGLTAVKSGSTTITHVIPPRDQRGVTAVASLGRQVFVARYQTQQQVEVYDAVTFALQRRLTVPGLGRECYGLAACPANNCLYASDQSNSSVHRAELSGSNAVMKWSVAICPTGLSVNKEHHLVVVSQRERKLQVFTTDGTLLLVIQLQTDVFNPWQAISLPTGQFLVIHEGPSLHRVCLVGVNGAVVRSYGGSPGSGLTQMNRPLGLAVDKKGCLLVADRNNKRLLVFDQSLTSGQELTVSVDRGLCGPLSLWYDQSRSRLYVGEYDNPCRLIVIDNVTDFSATQV